MNTTTLRYTPSELRRINCKRRRQRELTLHIIIAVLAVLLFISLFMFWGSSKSVASDGSTEVLYKYYTNIQVSSGDSLYDISKDYVVEGKLSTKDFIKEVVYMNNLESPDSIIAGSYIVVPYYDTYHG